jgi:aryl-alcohol dehydrogenase-like predicted oxidoreductase
MDFVVSSTSEKLHDIVGVLDEVAREIGKTVAQVALNWVLRRPTVSSVIFGSRNEDQLKQNLTAVGWSLDEAHVARLDAASEIRPVYPYWHQRQFPQLNPPPVPERGPKAKA